MSSKEEGNGKMASVKQSKDEGGGRASSSGRQSKEEQGKLTSPSKMTTRSKADPESGLRRRAAIAAMATAPVDLPVFGDRENRRASHEMRHPELRITLPVFTPDLPTYAGNKRRASSSSSTTSSPQRRNSLESSRQIGNRGSKESPRTSSGLTGKKLNDSPLLGRKRAAADITEHPARPSPSKKRKTVKLNAEEESEEITDTKPTEIDTKTTEQSDHTYCSLENESDNFCWLCHQEGTVICCELCPRVYHLRCLAIDRPPEGDWVCPECEKIMRAECVETRSKAMNMISVDQMCLLLKYALQRMKCQGSEPFQKPVDSHLVTSYKEYVFHPMDLSTLEKNVKKKEYGCTEALLADTKWILHNCIIFNGQYHKLTSVAKVIVKICKHEMSEIEVCPDCYSNSWTKKNDNWFCEPCRTPHPLVWAKLKGYPFWPAKALRENNGLVDVRFFGEHDRSWVPVSQIFMLSKDPPTVPQKTKGAFTDSMQELSLHIDRIRQKFGSFEYAPVRTPYDVNNRYDSRKVKFKVVQPGKKMKFGDAASTGKGSGEISPKKDDSRVADKQHLVKTVTALKNKYSSIITTRRAAGIKVPQKKFYIKAQKKRRMAMALSDKIQKTDQDDQATSSQVESKVESMIPSGVFTITSDIDPDVKKIQLNSKTGDSSFARKPKLPTPDIIKKLEVKIQEANQEEEEDEELPEQESNAKIVRESESSLPAEEKPKTIDSSKCNLDCSNTNCTDERTDNISKHDSKVQEKESQSANAHNGCIEAAETSSDAQTADSAKSKSEETEKGTTVQNPSDCSKEEEDITISATTSKPKNTYLQNLVANCKAKLGLSEEKILEEVSEEMSETETEEESDAKVTENEGPQKVAASDPKGDSSTTDSTDPQENTSDTRESKGQEKDRASESEHIKTATSTAVHSGESSIPKDTSAKVEKPAAQVEVSTADSTTETEADNQNVVASPSKVSSQPVEGKKQDQNKAIIEEQGNKGSAVEITKDVPSVGSNIADQRVNHGIPLDMDVDEMSDSDDNLVIDIPSDSASPTKRNPKDSSDSSMEIVEVRNQRDQKVVPSKDVSCNVSQKVDESEIIHIEPEKGVQTEFHETSSLSASTMMSPSVGSSKPDVATNSVKFSPGKVPKSSPTPSVIHKTSPAGRKGSYSTSHTSLVQALTQNKSPSPQSLSHSYQQDQDVGSRREDEASITKQNMSNLVSASSGTFDKYSKQMVVTLKSTFEKMYKEVLQTDPHKNIINYFEKQIKEIQWRHQQELEEVKHNANLTISELQTTFENEKLMYRESLNKEKQAEIAKIKKEIEKEKETAIEEVKKKQWCANCGKEAIFYCCWNTSYCDYPCQQAHWPQHMSSCTQSQSSQAGEQTEGQPRSSPAQPAHPEFSPGSKQQPEWTEKARDNLTNILRRQHQQPMQAPSSFSPSQQPSGPSSMVSPLVSMQATMNQMAMGGMQGNMGMQPPSRNLTANPTGPQGTQQMPRSNLMYSLQMPPQQVAPSHGNQVQMMPPAGSRPPVQLVRGPLYVPRSY